MDVLKMPQHGPADQTLGYRSVAEPGLVTDAGYSWPHRRTTGNRKSC